eukprot:jgi/Mesen1/2088/ME000151S01340
MGAFIQAKVSQVGDNGLQLDCGGGITCSIMVIRSNIVRTLFIKDDRLRQDKTWTFQDVDGTSLPWEGFKKLALPFKGPTTFTIEQEQNTVKLLTSALVLEISLSPFRLAWYTSDGKCFAQDRPSRPYSYATDSHAIRHYMQRNPRDKYYGLGDKTGPLDLHGRRLRTVMTDALGYNPRTGDPLYKHWPFLLSRDDPTGVCYGVLYDNLAAASFDLGCEHSNYYGLYRSYEAEDGDLDMYLMLGPEARDVVREMVNLTGRNAFPPRWSLGYHCTAMPLADAPDAQEKIADFLTQCLRHHIPCSAFHFGSGYTSIGKRRYVFNWNFDKFPDPRHLIQQFRAAGLRVVANVKPCLLTDHPRFTEVAALGAFVGSGAAAGRPCISQFWDGEGAHLDFTNPKAIEWWQENMQRALFDLGISAAWNDNNEYEVWDEDATCHGFGAPLPLRLARPLHSLLMTRASVEQQLRAAPGERPYAVTRGGCPGVQGYAQTWSGDNTTSWASLRWNLRTGLCMSMSGMFDVGHDVGGFAGPPPGPELLVRWTQTGVVHPRFLMNSWKADGTVTTPFMHAVVLPHVRWAIRLRYRLVPYLYACAWRAAARSEAILRPTFYAFPDDPTAWEDCDDLMVGPSLLAAPVVEEGARQRAVYLPRGPPGWYDFYSEDYYEAGQVITVAAALDRLPLFVPAGSILPLTAEALDFSRLHSEPSRVLRLFPVRAGEGRQVAAPCELYEDDGTCRDYTLPDRHRVLHVSMESDASEILVTLTSASGVLPLPFQTIQVAAPAADTRPLRLTVQAQEDEGEPPLPVALQLGSFVFHAL